MIPKQRSTALAKFKDQGFKCSRRWEGKQGTVPRETLVMCNVYLYMGYPKASNSNHFSLEDCEDPAHCFSPEGGGMPKLPRNHGPGATKFSSKVWTDCLGDLAAVRGPAGWLARSKLIPGAGRVTEHD